MVPSLKTEPSTLETHIVDGPMPNTGPSTLNTHIVDGSMSRTGPSTLAAEDLGQSRDIVTQIPHTVATAGRQAGPFRSPAQS